MGAADPESLDDKRRRSRARLRRWARWLDDAVAIPGTRLRVGVDAVVGLIPVAGDLAGLLLSGALFVEAVRLRAPTSLLARMAANAGIDFLIGLVPFAGDLADIAWRANRRNRLLLENWLDQELRPAPRARRWPGLLLLIVGAILALALSAYLMRALMA